MKYGVSEEANVVTKCNYSGIRLINPAAYYIQFAWNGIILCILENAVY